MKVCFFRCEPEPDVGTSKSAESIHSGEEGEEGGGERAPLSEQLLRQTIKEIRSEKDRVRALYDQVSSK